MITHQRDGEHQNPELLQVFAFIFRSVMHSQDINEETYRLLRSKSCPGWVELSPQYRHEVNFRFPCSRPLSRHDTNSPPGARIPLELFDSILYYVGSHCWRKASKGLIWRPSLDNIDDSLHTLKMCSLVCHRWADLCRQHIFCDATLIVSSHASVEALVAFRTSSEFAVRPVLGLIRAIEVRQTYNTSRLSFCHLLSHPRVVEKLYRLHLTGPIPGEFPRFFRRDSPHWSVPPIIVTPPSLMKYKYIFVDNIHLPTFSHVAKYVKHLAHAGGLRFNTLTWDRDAGPESSYAGLLFRAPRSRRRSQQDKTYLHIQAIGCTNKFYLCFAAAMTHPSFLLCALSIEDYQQMYLWAMSQEWGFEQSVLSYCITNIELVTPKGNSVKVASFCQDSDGSAALRLFGIYRNTGPDTPQAQVELIGAHACFGSMIVSYSAFLLFITRLGRFPTLRTVVLEFEDFASLQAIIEHCRPLPQVHDRTYRIVHRDQPQHRLSNPEQISTPVHLCCPNETNRVEVDPGTLTRTGKIWAKDHDIILSLLDM